MAVQTQFNEEKPVRVSTFGKVIWYISFILIIPIFVHIAFRNSVVRMETKVNEADSGIDVQLTKRREMLEKLIDATKQTMKWEKDTLTQITELRKTNPATLKTKEKSEFNQRLDALQGQINVQLEAYPTLTATQAVKNLQAGIAEVEDNIAAARRIYNSNVSIFNQEIQVYPKNVAASAMKKTTKIFFEADEHQKSDVKVDLDV
jgi:LemA protein